MSDSTGLAVDAIKTMYDFWKVDPERVQWVGDPSALLHELYGFDWWPSNFKVEVRVYGPHPELDPPTFRLSVRTDYLCDVDVGAREFKQYIAEHQNWRAPLFATCAHPTALSELVQEDESLGGLGLDFKSSNVWLSSTAYLTEDNKDWLPWLLASAAILQIDESNFMAEHVMSRLGGKLNRSQPIGRLPLTRLNELLTVVQRGIENPGKLPSKWIGTGEFEKIVEEFERLAPEAGRANDRGMNLEIPFGADTATLVLDTGRPHAFLENGLNIYLELPHESDLDSLSDVASEMNFMEDRSWCREGMPLMGGWIAAQLKENQPRFALVYRSFIPNLLYRPGLAKILVGDAVLRAQWARGFLLPNSLDIPLPEILETRKSARNRTAHLNAEKRSLTPESNATDKSNQTSVWRTILIGSLVTGALLLIAFFLSNNPSNPFRTRVTIGTSGIDMVERPVAPWAFRNKPS